jgi:hypothetical protein
MVNALVNRFADVHRENPARPLVHAPGAGITLTASDVWDLHRRYADQLGSLGLESDQLIVSAVGNHHDSVSLLLACGSIAVMPVDAGNDSSRGSISARALARRLVLPSDVAAVWPGPDPGPRRVQRTALRSPFGNGLSVVVPENGTPARYPNAGLLKLTSGSTGLEGGTTDAQLSRMAPTWPRQ